MTQKSKQSVIKLNLRLVFSVGPFHLAGKNSSVATVVSSQMSKLRLVYSDALTSLA